MFPIMLQLQLDVADRDRAAVGCEADVHGVDAGAQDIARHDELRAHPARVLEAQRGLERARFAAVAGVGEVGPVDARVAGLSVVRHDDGRRGEVGIQHFEGDDGGERLCGEFELPLGRGAGRFASRREARDARVHGRLHAAEKFRIFGRLRLGEIAEGIRHCRCGVKINGLFRRRVLQRTCEHAADVAAVAGHGDVEIVRAVEWDGGAFTRRQARADTHHRAAEKLASALGPRGDGGLHAGQVVEENAQQDLAVQRGYAAEAHAIDGLRRFAVLRGDGFVLEGFKPDRQRGFCSAGFGKGDEIQPHGEGRGLLGQGAGLLGSRERSGAGNGEERAEEHRGEITGAEPDGKHPGTNRASFRAG